MYIETNLKTTEINQFVTEGHGDQMSCIFYALFCTHFVAFAIAVKLIFSVDDAHLNPRNVL